MKLKQFIFLVWICFRHGINPLRNNKSNAIKYQLRLSNKEKSWVVNNCHENAKDYFEKLMYGN